MKKIFVFLIIFQHSIEVFSTQTDIFLNNFFQNVDSASGKFIQFNTNQKDQPQEVFSGIFSFKRSSHSFKWIIQKPYSQTILSDGRYFFQYDAGLLQVIQKKIDSSFEDSPIKVLFGNIEIKKKFDIKKLSDKDNLKWFRLITKEKNVSFVHLDLGFNKNLLEKIEFLDFFDKKIQIKFLEIRINPIFSTNEFSFSIPENVDIIRM